MAHFAELDENNFVIRVLVISNDILLDENGKEIESKGIDFLKNLYGENRRWVQTSYNHNFRKQFGFPDFRYDEEKDVFVKQQPYPSWTLNKDTMDWEPPFPQPLETDDTFYWWCEATQEWKEVYDPGWRVSRTSSY